MSKLPCEVIRDLFPSYIDGLTSEASNQAVEEHLAGCEECRKLLSSMKGGGEAFAPEEPEKKEIDYLKKNRRRTVMIVLFSILGVLALGILVVALRFFVIGDKGRENDFIWTVEVSGTPESVNKTLKWKVSTGGASAVKAGDVRIEEQDGVVTIYANCVWVAPTISAKNGFTKEGTYTASQEINQVLAGSRVIWAEGQEISPIVSDLWATRHDYVGDIPANTQSALALNLYEVFGPWTNELETKAHPYGWTIRLLYDPAEDPDICSETNMRKAAYLLFAVIGNLDRITFSYSEQEVSIKEFTFTREEADAFFGMSVSMSIYHPKLLEDLYRKVGWRYVLAARSSSPDIPPWDSVDQTITP